MPRESCDFPKPGLLLGFQGSTAFSCRGYFRLRLLVDHTTAQNVAAAISTTAKMIDATLNSGIVGLGDV